MRLANISSTHVDNTMFAKLIGSVCHEVGNHLVAMRLHAHLLEDEEKDAEPMTNVAMLSARAIRLLRQVQQLSLTRCGGDRPVARHSINILKEHIHTLETGSQRIQLNVADDLLESEIVTDSLLGQIIELLKCFMENSVHEQLQVVIEKTERSPSFRIEARFQNDKKTYAKGLSKELELSLALAGAVVCQSGYRFEFIHRDDAYVVVLQS